MKKKYNIYIVYIFVCMCICVIERNLLKYIREMCLLTVLPLVKHKSSHLSFPTHLYPQFLAPHISDDFLAVYMMKNIKHPFVNACKGMMRGVHACLPRIISMLANSAAISHSLALWMLSLCSSLQLLEDNQLEVCLQPEHLFDVQL